MPLGLTVDGQVQMCNIAAMPHLLVAGSTGSGKSVCINTIMVGLLMKNTPYDLRFIMIDPKKVEFSAYEHIPHLYLPIVTDMARAAGVLACAVNEMERRYTLLQDVGVKNIDDYKRITLKWAPATTMWNCSPAVWRKRRARPVCTSLSVRNAPRWKLSPVT